MNKKMIREQEKSLFQTNNLIDFHTQIVPNQLLKTALNKQEIMLRNVTVTNETKIQLPQILIYNE